MAPTRLINTEGLPSEALDFAWNRAYFCPQCGRIWCRWTRDQMDWIGAVWYSFHKSCPDHANGHHSLEVPGSMITCRADIVVLPRELLEYELLNLMERT